MDDKTQTDVAGRITDIFAHRFVLETPTGRILADLGPKGLDRFRPSAGDQVEVSGEMKPSELKVARIARAGGEPVLIERKDRHSDDTGLGDSLAALRTVERNGFTVVAPPRRKPKHFEILGRDKAGDLVELHVALDGTLRKTKPIEADDQRWAGPPDPAA